MIKEDCIFAAFARQCTMNPLHKKKGIPQPNHQLSTTHRSAQDVQGLDGEISFLHSSKSSASPRFHLQSTLLKKEMDNELTIVFSSDLEEHSHHKKLKRNRIFYPATARFGDIRLVFEGVAANFFASTG